MIGIAMMTFLTPNLMQKDVEILVQILEQVH